MQAWIALKHEVAQHHIQAAHAAQLYVDARLVHGPLAAAAAAVALAPGQAFAQAAGLAAGHDWLLLRCSCAHNNCCRVLQLDSIRMQMWRGGDDPLTCPAFAPHAHMCHTFSPFVVHFYAVMMQLWPHACVIWDWHDVPGLPRYHFDATVILLQMQLRHARFEIDGPCHFSRNYTVRRVQDAVKDATVTLWHVPMLRLHVRDQPTWGQTMLVFMQNAPVGARYTQHFVMCLPAADLHRLL